MKKNILTILFIVSSKFIFAQSTDEVVWFGLDFTQARMIGSEGFTDVPKIKDYYFNEWNNVIVTEADKFDIKKYFGRSNVKRDLSVVERRNKTVNTTNLVTNNTYTLDRNAVDKVIKDYKSKESGVGLVFIVESFDKTKEKAYVYVTTFDIATKKIIKCEKIEGSPSGFGFRNYWLGAIASIMKAASKKMK
jgi:hypothetical protein